MSSQKSQLEELEAKLRETEERLKQKQSRSSSPATGVTNGRSSPHRRQGLESVFGGTEGYQPNSSGRSPLSSPTAEMHDTPRQEQGYRDTPGSAGRGQGVGEV